MDVLFTGEDWNEVLPSLAEGEAVLGGFGRTVEPLDIQQNFDFGTRTRDIQLEFDFWEMDSWDGERFFVQIGDHRIDLGAFAHNDADIQATGQDGAFDVFVSDRPGKTNPDDHGGNNRWGDEKHRVVITTDAFAGEIQIGFGSTLDQDARDESWRVENFKIYGKPVNTPPASVDAAIDLGDRSIDGTFGIVAGAIHEARDADGDTLIVTRTKDAVGGTVKVSKSGNLFFTPDDGFTGEASFVAVISDGRGAFAERMVVFNVLAEPPVMDSGPGGTDEDVGDEPRITFALIDPMRDAIIGSLASGDTIALDSLPDETLGITATPTVEGVSSAVFHLDGAAFRTENVAPYALFSDVDGDFQPGRLAPGEHLIEVAFHAGANGSGQVLETAALTINVVNHAGAPDPGSTPDPNPIPQPDPTPAPDPGPTDTVRWSEAFGSVGPNGRVVIEAGQRVLLNQDADVGTIIVDGGELIVQDGRDVTLSTDWLLVMDGGLFQVGTPDSPHQSNFTLELTGDDRNRDTDLRPYMDGTMPGMNMQIEDNDAFLMAMGVGSTISIHAADAEKETWSQLRATAEQGDTILRLNEATDWEVGDTIAIASSEFDHEQDEQRTIIEIRHGGRDVVLDRALEYRHYGGIESYSNGKTGADARSWDIDMRSEVGLLSRNVTITGDENADQDRFGGHTMVMRGAEIYVSGAEFTKLGQEGILGRYGAHWHLNGDASGQYVENSSFHDIYNKGVTLHGVQNVRVEDNVVFGTIGHSYFTEDASEFGNTIKDNLGFGTKAARSEGSAVTTADFDHVSTFWIENPNNTITGNHAAGSDFAGFWFAPSDVHGESKASGEYNDLSPRDDAIRDFVGNSAHSNEFNLGVEGHVSERGDGKSQFQASLYNPDEDWEIRDFTAYKSSDRSIWTRAFGGDFVDIKSADNTRATFFSYTSTMVDSVIVGKSNGNGQNPGLHPERGDQGHRGHSIYDGPSGIDNVHFANFNGRDQAIQTNGAAEKSATHWARGITFENVAEANKVDFTPVTFRDYMWASGLRDIDGSITGIKGATLTPIIGGEFSGSRINVAGEAERRNDWGAWVITDDRIDLGWLHMRPIDHANSTHNGDYDLIRSDGEEVLGQASTFDKFPNPNVVVGEDHSYRFRFHELPSTNGFDVGLHGVERGTSLIYAFEDLPRNANVMDANEVANAAQLNQASTTSYYWSGNDLVLKFVAETQSNKRPNSDDPEVLRLSYSDTIRVSW